MAIRSLLASGRLLSLPLLLAFLDLRSNLLCGLSAVSSLLLPSVARSVSSIGLSL